MTIACSVPPGAGGLGRHFQELIEIADSSGLASVRYIYPSPASSGPGHIPTGRWVRGGRFLADVPGAFAYPLFVQAACISFDLGTARVIPEGGGLTAFASHALRSFRRARRLGIQTLGLAAPNSHVDNLKRQQELARSRNPIDRGWLTASLRRRTIQEYELADVILISSEYQRSTFLEFGVDAGKLLKLELRPDSRFRPRERQPSEDTFNIVYVGRFDLIKGIPVLLDAFASSARADWRLTLMGAFSSHGLRTHVERRVGEDSRITLLGHGDPGPILEAAHLFVHPSFEDGFGYAPMEALAVGVPVVVTDQTGMAEHVREGINGFVVPAGDADALADRLRHCSERRGV